MNYYLVTAKCGHVGHSRYISIVFPIAAENGREAARYARKIPRVKHDHKDAILNVEKVSYEDYYNQRLENNNDPYLQITRRQDQKYLEGFEERLEKDTHRDRVKYQKDKCTDYKRRKQQIRNYFYEDDFYDYEMAL